MKDDEVSQNTDRSFGLESENKKRKFTSQKTKNTVKQIKKDDTERNQLHTED